jgi:hypothetical protein
MPAKKILVLLALVSAPSMSGCSAPRNYILPSPSTPTPNITLRCMSECEGPPQFRLKSEDIEYVYNVRFLAADLKETIWSLDVCGKLEDFTYGKLPTIEPISPQHLVAKQTFPADDKLPRRLISGEQFYVVVGFYGKCAGEPHADDAAFLFQVQQDSSAQSLSLSWASESHLKLFMALVEHGPESFCFELLNDGSVRALRRVEEQISGSVLPDVQDFNDHVIR